MVLSYTHSTQIRSHFWPHTHAIITPMPRRNWPNDLNVHSLFGPNPYPALSRDQHTFHILLDKITPSPPRASPLSGSINIHHHTSAFSECWFITTETHQQTTRLQQLGVWWRHVTSHRLVVGVAGDVMAVQWTAREAVEALTHPPEQWPPPGWTRSATWPPWRAYVNSNLLCVPAVYEDCWIVLRRKRTRGSALQQYDSIRPFKNTWQQFCNNFLLVLCR